MEVNLPKYNMLQQSFLQMPAASVLCEPACIPTG